MILFWSTRSVFPQAKVKMPVLSPESGFIIHMDARADRPRRYAARRGACREGGCDRPGGGNRSAKETGDFVHRGETVAQLFTNLESEGQIAQAAALFLTAIRFSETQHAEEELIYCVIGENRE